MKNLKKLLSLGMAVALSISVIPNVLAEEDTLTIPGEEVLYYNTFPTGTDADLPEVEHELYYFYGRNAKLKNALNVTREYTHTKDDGCAAIKNNYNMALDGLQPVEFNGNTGVRVGSNCSIAAGPIVMLDFRYKDSDKTPTEEGALKTGVYKLAFDFVLDGSVSKSDGLRVEANCMHGNCGNSFAWIMDKTWHNLSGGNTWNYTQKDIPITNNELHRYEIIFDLDADRAIVYMDGIRYDNINFKGNINFLHVTIGGKMKYVDNMLFTKIDEDYSAEMTAEILSNDETGMTVKFSDFIATMSGFSNITYTNKMTGEVIKTTPVGVADSPNTIKITPEKELEYGYSYTLNADVEVPGLRGHGSSAVIESQDITLGVVKNINAVDYNGQESVLGNNITANTDGFVFEFVPGEDAESILSNLAIYDALGNDVDIKVEPTDELNVAKVKIVKNLKGNTEYSIILNGLEKPYEWKFKTGDGGFTVKPIKFYKADGTTPVELSDVKVGDKIKAKYEVVNTGETMDLSFALTMGLYSKNGLIDFNYENVELKDGVDYYTTTAEFTVSRTEDLNARGFIWETINTRKPLYKPVVTK